MDPAKVDGLARVLHRAARTRQIVVFTHDDRLPEAIRRLRLDATMLHVDRRAHSTVDVQVSRAARSSATSTARAATRSRTGCRPRSRRASCRCSAAARSRPPRRTSSAAAPSSTAPSLDEADEQIDEARTLRETLALVLFGEAGRQGEVGREIRKRYGATSAALVTELNRGAHGDRARPATLKRLPDSTRDFIHAADAMKRQRDVLDEAAAPAGRVRPGDLRRLAARGGGADPPVAGVDAGRLLAHRAPGHAGDELRATAGRACPPTSATARRRARPTSPGPRSSRPATTAPTRSGSRRTSCAGTSRPRGSSWTRSASSSLSAGMAPQSIALVLAGGGARGAYEAGVLSVLLPALPEDRAPEPDPRRERRRDQRRLPRRDAARRRRPRARRRPRDLGGDHAGATCWRRRRCATSSGSPARR